MSYQDYQGARDAAWRILLDCGVDRLPVDLNAICGALGVRVYSYHTARSLIDQSGLLGLSAETDGLSFFMRQTPVILFDETLPPQRIRFTAAHELGHIVLEHVVPGRVSTRNREPRAGDAPEETAANQFAARLLAPACVLWGLGLREPEDIARVCRISRQAAEFRAKRMAELYSRDRFLASPLEREVYRQFLPFIREMLAIG